MVATRRSLQAPLLLLGPLLCSLLRKGSASNPSQNRAPSTVNGRQGGSVLLQINISTSGNAVNKIEWTFQPKNSRSLTVVEFQGGEIHRLNPRDRFGERLEAINETTLQIKDLELEDGGLYEAKARLSSAENEKYLFNLTIHEPVPELQIRPHLASSTPVGCNVTLQCGASGPGEFSLSWRGGNPLRSLEGSEDWYQLSGNGTDLHLFWEPNPLYSQFTCQVSNAVEQKEVSFDLLSICSDEGRSRTRLVLLSLLCVLVLLPAGALGTWQWKKRRKTLSHSEVSEIIPAEPQYAAIVKRRNPPKGNEDQDPDPDQKSSTSTVYAQLTRPLQSSEQVP